jgi:tetratricopeptide (TPR) repeat protein
MDELIMEKLKAGKIAYNKKDYSRAKDCLTQFLEEKEDFADVHNMLGVIYYSQGMLSKAQTYFERALAINSRYIEAALNLAVTYNELGRYDDATRIYNEVLATSKGSTRGDLDPLTQGKVANMHVEIAEVYQSSGLCELAIEEYNKALELAPGFVDIRVKLAQILRDSGKSEQALSELNRVLTERPKYTKARIDLGITLYCLKRTEEAIEEWEKVLEQEPDNARSNMYLRLTRTKLTAPIKNQKSDVTVKSSK